MIKFGVKFFTAIMSVVVFINIGFAQQAQLDKIVPASPETAQLTKLINTPVNLSTGSVSVEVPVYTIETKNFRWPLSLSYSSGGIKVDEISSCIGLGWILQGNGIVSRSIAGTADEENGLLNNNIPYVVTDFGQLGQQQRETMIQSILAGIDSEPDKFSFSVNGKSGSFYLHRTKGVVLQTYDDVEIVFNGNTPVITDNLGNKYFFTAYESGVARNLMLSDAQNGSGIEEVHDGITAWYLTKVESADQSDVIDFIYSGTYTVRQEQEAWSFKIGQKGSTYANACQTGLQQPDLKKSNLQVTTSNVPVLSEIRFKNGKILFNYLQDRLDMNGGTNPIGNQGRLASVSIYTVAQNSYELLQKIVLTQSYFTTNVPVTKNPAFGYRLKLDAVAIIDKNNVPLLSPFSFEYNNTALPYRTSPAQDFLGYYNGADGNTTLTPNRIIEWNENGNSSIYNIGTANRQVNEQSMQACILKSIKYPTGGYTNFEYEAHRYYEPNLNSVLVPPSTQQVTETITATPGTTINNPKVRFVNDGSSQQVSISGFFKAFYGKSDLPPYVKIKKVETGNTFSNILTLVSSNGNIDRFESATYNLISGAEYEIEAYVHAGSYPANEVWSTIVLTRSRITNPGGTTVIGGIRIIGGLRIKSKSDYTKVDEIASKEMYTYGSGGEGICITHLAMLNREYRNVYTRELFQTSAICAECPVLNYRLYNDQSPYAAATVSGSPIAYSRVQKKQLDKSGNSLGMEVYYYNILTDDFDIFPGTDNFYSLSKDWQNNKLWKYEVYSNEANGSSFLVKSQETYYNNFKQDVMYNLIVIPKANQFCSPMNYQNYTIFQGRKYTGKRLPVQTVITMRSKNQNGQINTLTETTNFEYSTTSSHTNPIVITKQSSSQKSIVERNFYAEDMINLLNDNGNGIYTSMIQKGQKGLLVLKKLITDNITTREIKTEYSSPFGTFIKPTALYLKSPSSAFDLLKSMNYLENGNLKQQTLKENVPNIYLWGYNSRYPVAEVIGSDWNTVKNLIDQTILDNVNGQYTDQQIRNELNKIRIGLATSKALVTTYTYKPLVGITSETDLNGKTIYYEYDAFNRLTLVRDNDNNILKKLCYNYAGQPENCGGTVVYKNIEKSGNFTRNDCPAGYTGNSVTYTVPANIYTSTISQPAADALAQNDVTTNGQAYANVNGVCSPAPVPFKVYTHSYYPYTITFDNISTSAHYSFTIPANVYNYSLPGIAEGDYNITITGPAGSSSMYSLGGSYYGSGEAISFYNFSMYGSYINNLYIESH